MKGARERGETRRKTTATAGAAPHTPQKERERAAAIRRILEDCAELRRDPSTLITHREVEALRVAFVNVMTGVVQTEWSKQAIQCDNVLWQLEEMVKGRAESATGDADRELSGSENWKFANIPKQRRLQTLAVTLMCFFTGLPLVLFVCALLLVVSPYTRWFMVAYSIYCMFVPLRFPVEKRSWWVNANFFKLYRDYFPIRLVIPKKVRAQITPGRPYVFCYHPHGVASFGAAANFCTESNGIGKLLPGIDIHVQTLRINFKIPVWRQLFIWAGMGDASAETIRRTLGLKKSVLLVVGGAEESLLAAPRTNKLTLIKRKGFVKLALEHGAPLVPCFSFGETNVYGNYATGRPWLQALLSKLQKRLGFAIPLVKGRFWFNYNFGPLPHRRQIITVVGEPLVLPRIERPTSEDIKLWHARYCDALITLYQENHLVYDVYVEQGASIVS